MRAGLVWMMPSPLRSLRTTNCSSLRKAIALYVAATHGEERGLKVGFANPDQTLETEFVDL